jgi:hypothetical protein
MMTRPLLIPAALMTVLVTALPARAQEVKVSVVAILASTRSTEIHKDLKELAVEVKKLDPSLKGFQPVHRCCKPVQVGSSETFRLVEDMVAEVTVESACEKEGRVRVRVKPPLAKEITYSIVCDKFVPFLTRYETKDKQKLLIAVRVQCCKGKK